MIEDELPLKVLLVINDQPALRCRRQGCFGCQGCSLKVLLAIASNAVVVDAVLGARPDKIPTREHRRVTANRRQLFTVSVPPL